MARYDGLIIPRSYSEYINKTDSATLQQALQLGGVLDSAPTEDSVKPIKSGGVYDAIAGLENEINGKQDALTFDDVPTASSNNPVKSNGVYDALAGKQNTLTFDNAPTQDSDNPVKSGGIYDEIEKLYFSNATQLTSTSNLNNIKTEGLYFCNGAVLPQNAPSRIAANLYNCLIKVMKQGTANRYVQEFYTLNGNAKYTRTCGVAATDTWSAWEKVITPKVKEVTGITSANGNLQLELDGSTNVVIAVQTHNSQGFNNNMIAIPYKLGDDRPDTSPTGKGRWGVHCIAANGSNTVQANTNVYLTVFYYER